MDDQEKEFEARLKKEQEERAYQEWKKSNDPQEIEKSENFDILMFLLFCIPPAFGIWYTFFR